MTDELTKDELLEMVARQMKTILFLQNQITELQNQITEALQAIDNQAPDLAWRKLLAVKERFQ